MKKEILLKKESGSLSGILLGICVVLTILIVVVVVTKDLDLMSFKTNINRKIEKSLDSSVAATKDYVAVSMLGDMDVADDESLQIYGDFKKLILNNLNLDMTTSESEYVNTSVIGKAKETDNDLTGDVTLKEFKMYYVLGNSVVCKSINNGIVTSTTLTEDTAKTPNGIKIKNPCIYVDIEFNVKGYWNATATANQTALYMINEAVDNYDVPVWGY